MSEAIIPAGVQRQIEAANVERLEARLRMLEERLALYELHGLADTLSGSGNQRFGNGSMRLGSDGIQLQSTNWAATDAAINMVETIVNNPQTVRPRGTLYGDYWTSGGEALLTTVALAANHTAYVKVEADAGYCASTLGILIGTTTGQFPYLAVEGYNGSPDKAHIIVGNGAPFVVGTITSDPSVYLADGGIWYRTDTDKFRARANGATENLATESWVAGGLATLALPADISPSQITSDQNNYDPTGLSTATVLRLSTDASRDITGLAGGADGRLILIFNVGAQNIVLKDESASSTAANRFALNGDVTLAADESAALWYDHGSLRWRRF